MLTRTVLKSFMHFAWDQNHSENEWKAVINWSPSENMESVQKKIDCCQQNQAFTNHVIQYYIDTIYVRLPIIL